MDTFLSRKRRKPKMRGVILVGTGAIPRWFDPINIGKNPLVRERSQDGSSPLFSNSGKLALGDIAADFGLVRLILIIDLSIFLQFERYICWQRLDRFNLCQLNPISNKQIVRHKSCQQRQ